MTTPSSPPSTTSPSLRRLVDETSDLIDSPTFSHVLTLLLDAAFTHLVDAKIGPQSYKMPRTSASRERVVEIVGTEGSAKLANTLAVFCRQAHAIGASAENEYLSAMEEVRDLEAFAAVVYSSNFEFEAPDSLPVADNNGGGHGAGRGGWEAASQAQTPAAPAAAEPAESVPARALDQETGIVDGGDLEKAWAKATGTDEVEQK